VRLSSVLCFIAIESRDEASSTGAASLPMLGGGGAASLPVTGGGGGGGGGAEQTFARVPTMHRIHEIKQQSPKD